eukprot:c23944_g2_i1 orf=103-1398(+)
MQGVIGLGTSLSLRIASLSLAACSSEGVFSTDSFSFFASRWRRQFAPLKASSTSRKWPKKSALYTANRPGSLSLVMASAHDGGNNQPIAPLQPESPTGQFLVQLLQSHPHLVRAAAEQQLDKLAEDRDAESGQEQPSSKGTELVLYRRIAELKVQERRMALEEIMYALISQKFVEGGISMVPQISSLSDSERMDSLPVQDKELESVHSTEALEMIQEHLTLVLGGRRSADHLNQSTIAQLSKLRVGQVYAASVMYGYFLRRVDQRFQLEKTMKILPPSLNQTIETEQTEIEHADADDYKKYQQGNIVTAAAAIARAAGMKEELSSAEFDRVKVKPSKLRSYVMSFDAETLHRYAMIRSKESVSVIEKHTEALFGRPEIQVLPDGSMAITKDEVIRLSFSGLRRLVLEAVAFGTFLWDVETYVDSRYHFVSH